MSSSCGINSCTQGAASRSLAALGRTGRAVGRQSIASKAISAGLHVHSVSVRATGTQAHSTTALLLRSSVPKLFSYTRLLTAAFHLPSQQQARDLATRGRVCAISTSATSVEGAQASPSRMSRAQMIQDTIEPNDVERQLFQTLLEAAKHADTNTVLRCAGGWVRDKLLGRDSLDIDIALDNMLGKDFAEKVNAYLQSQGKAVRSAAVIQSNPDQSKHLETARMKINDIWIDLVNLRSETYAQDSRIPSMEFGTAEQDAMRRDFTINALFYNLNQGCVEDLSGRGLQDLRDGIIRTPLPPQETFLDDPLRVLRAVRFGTRFGFEYDTALLEAASSEQVRTALGQKVSKERVGTELEGMFNGPDPVGAMRLLHRLKLFPVVFALPPSVAAAVGPGYGERCVECMAAAPEIMKARGMQLDQEERRFLLLSALLLPLAQCTSPTGPKGKQLPVVQYIVRESIKWRAKDADTSVLLHETAAELMAVHQQLSSSGAGTIDGQSAPDSVKLALGNAIRKLKQHWRLGCVLAPLTTLPEAAPLGVDSPTSSGSSTGAGTSTEARGGSATDVEARTAQLSEATAQLLSAAEAFGLQDCWQWKPLLDGKQVQALLGLQKPGPELGKAMSAAMDWQLTHPSGSAEECKEAVKQWWEKSRAS